jgi:hypothetical protein
MWKQIQQTDGRSVSQSPRFAWRPTDQLALIEDFYSGDLRLPVLYRFENHAGYDGVMLGFQGTDYHLEFTSHVDGSLVRPDPPQPTRSLLSQRCAMYDAVERLAAAGHEPVEAENHLRAAAGALTFEDSDGWRVVLVPKPVFQLSISPARTQPRPVARAECCA